MSDAAGAGPDSSSPAGAGCDGSDGADAAWADLGDLSDLADGQLRSFADLGRHGIVVCRVDGKLHALVDNCSHADTPLSSGRLRGPVLVCPLHGSGFDVRDGSVQGPPAFEDVAIHAVTESAEGAAVDLTPRMVDADDGIDIGARLQTR